MTKATMDDTVLPAVRIPTVPAGQGEDGELSRQETPLVDLPPSEKFGFAWPDSAATVNSTASSVFSAVPMLPSNESTSETSDIDSSEPEPEPSLSRGYSYPVLERDVPEQRTPSIESTETNPTPVPRSPPRLSRAYSMPLPSQLGHLKNPHRSRISTPYPPPSPLALSNPPNNPRFHDLSLELADSVQMVIQTLLQISPPHLLDPAKEQFSACSLSVPSSSISAMLTTLKNLNYMSANMQSFASGPLDTINEEELPESNLPTHDEFDIGEVLQSVGDSLSGLASQAGVDLVLYHGDVGMKHVGVTGDECGVSSVLSHIIRQVMDTTHVGDSIEIGLFIKAEHIKRSESRGPSDTDDDSRAPSRASSGIPDFEGPIRCTFDIAHKFSTPSESHRAKTSPSPSPVPFRMRPNLDSLILRRLVRRVNGTITPDLTPRLFSPGRSIELSVLVEVGSPDLLAKALKLAPEEEASRQPFANANIQLAAEPSLEELFTFLDTLKGKKVALFASGKGSFAHHLTSYLTAWGLDVSHTTGTGFSVGASEDLEDAARVRRRSTDTLTGDRSVAFGEVTESPAVMEKSDLNPLDGPLGTDADSDGIVRAAFIVIDDDVDALRQQLSQLRSEAPFNGSGGVNMNLKLNPSIAARRPNLSSLHRPKSSPHVPRAKLAKQVQVQPVLPQPPPVIIHFTSLSNYKLVKDIVNSVLSSPLPQSDHSNMSTPHASSYGPISYPVPEVIVIPKPAGPRRLLVALRTALTKPIVDSFFTPIATSPMSPTTGLGFPGGPMSPFSAWGWNHGGGGSPSSHVHSNAHRGAGRPPISPRTASDRSQRSGASANSKDSLNEHMHGFMPAHRPGLPPSPLGHPDSMEYFSEAAMKLGTSPSSGLVIQSPNGQPAGIFFHPRGAGNRTFRGERNGVTDVGSTGIQPPSLVRDTGNLKPPGEPYRPTPRRRHIDTEGGPTRPSYTRQRVSLSHRNTEGVTSHGDAQIVALSPSAAANELAGRTRRPAALADDRGGSQSNISTSLNAPPPINHSTISPIDIPPLIPSTFSPRQSAADVLSRRAASPPSVSVQRLANASTMSGPSPSGSPTAAAPVHAAAATGGQIPSPTTVQPKRPIRRMTDSPENVKKGKSALDSIIVPPVNVLIVEDNPINQTILSTFMKKKRIKYDVAKNGAEAVAKWKSGGFHLILMDIQMPVMDGIEATKEIRRLERLNSPSTPSQEAQKTPSDAASSGVHTPYSSSVIIVALTASSLQSDRVNALAAGCNDFLTKPVSLKWLNSKIIEWGSIKALQMWADLRPDVVKNIASGQAAQARTVASKLQLPERRKASQASSSSRRESSAAYPVEPSMTWMYGEHVQTRAEGVGKARERAVKEKVASNPTVAQDNDALAVAQLTQATGVNNTDNDVHSDSSYKSSDSNCPADTTPQQPSTKPLHQINGKQALLAHLKSLGSKQNEGQHPVFLGERASTSAIRSIAEVINAGSISNSSGAVSPLALDPPFIPEAEDEGITIMRSESTDSPRPHH